LGEERGFGLDPSVVIVEKFPLIVSPSPNIPLRRIYPRDEQQEF
jgi:KUP system potassium uptake protein